VHILAATRAETVDWMEIWRAFQRSRFAYNRILLCVWALGHCSVCSFEGVSCHIAFVLYVTSTSLRLSVQLWK